MSEQILSQNEIDALLSAVTLSNTLRKIIQVSVESTSLMKYGEFLNYLPIPSCLNICRMHPLRGSVVISVEAKLIFAFLNNFFGGSTNAQERVEGRDFTAIELMIIRRVVKLLLGDLQTAWQPVYPVDGEYIRTEINPQFLAVAPPSDVVVLSSFELEMDNLRGTVQVVLPYSTIEPIRHLLQNAAQSEAERQQAGWRDQISLHLRDVDVAGRVFLGRSRMSVHELLGLEVGDVLTLDQGMAEPLLCEIEGHHKFRVRPMTRAGHLAVEVIEPVVTSSEQAWLEAHAAEAAELAGEPT